MAKTVEVEAKEQESAVVNEALAKSRRFFQEYSKAGNYIDKFLKDIRTFESAVIQLLNAEAAIDARIKAKELDLARIETECRNRLSNMEAGHRALIDKVTKRESEAESAKAEADKLKQALSKERADLAVVKAAYEAKLNALAGRK